MRDTDSDVLHGVERFLYALEPPQASGKLGIVGIPGEIKVRWHRDLPAGARVAAAVLSSGTRAAASFAAPGSVPEWSVEGHPVDDANGEDPPEGHFITKIWDLWDQTSAEPDEAKRNALWFQILDIWAEEIPMIGILGELPAPVIVKNGFKGSVVRIS